MEDDQSSRKDGVEASISQVKNEDEVSAAHSIKMKTLELRDKMKKTDQTTTTVSLLAKNAALLPSGIARVKELRDSNSNKAFSAISSGSATGNPRNKTVLAPGHSLMDWIRLGSSGVDLTGVGGKHLTVAPAELAKHNKSDDAWIAIRGIVFNVSRYMNFHPGGVPELMKGVGKDATKLFDDAHAWVNYQSMLQKCVVGRLEHSLNVDFSVGNNECTIPSLPSIKMDWQQTTSTISLFYSWSKDNQTGECQIKRLSDSELSLRLCLEKFNNVVTHNVKLTEEVDWPPTYKKSNELPEIEINFKKKKKNIWKTYGRFTVSYEKKESTLRTYTEYEVFENTPLCPRVHLLTLRARNYIQIVPPARHVEVKIDVMGTQVSRPYTPVPNWLHSEDRPLSFHTGEDNLLCLMVKRYDDGAMSPILTALLPGQTLLVSCSLGDFRPETYDQYATMHMLAAGTGLTAMLPIIKRALTRRSPQTMNLINFNKNKHNVFFDEQLQRLSEKHKFTITHVLSEADGTWTGRTGVVSTEVLRDLIGEYSKKACVFICGPPGFLRAALESLESLGWEPSQIHEFGG